MIFNPSEMIVGIDFDNTLIDYDSVFYKTAIELNFISPDHNSSKRKIRDTIRLLAEGEKKWQKLQAIVYGINIKNATLYEGVNDFIEKCCNKNIRTYIISHKTEYAAYSEEKINLRAAALCWMQEERLFSSSAINPQNVFFESSRQKKVAKIKDLGCTYFIDDLEETFLEVDFPDKVTKIFFNPHQYPVSLCGVEVSHSWSNIAGYIFNNHKILKK